MNPEHVRGLRNGVLRHPFELTICVITLLSIYALIRILLDRPEILGQSQHGLLRLPSPILWVWCASGIAGSMLMITGLTMSAFSEKGMDLESAGLHLSVILWASTFVVTVVAQPTAIQIWGQYLSIACGCLVRIMAIGGMRAVVHNAKEAQNE